jgi:hypothetical protein
METISEHDAAKVRCPKCNSKKVTQVPGRIRVVNIQEELGFLALLLGNLSLSVLKTKALHR